jgi:uncharacterized protein (TIGR03067 family)
MTRTGWKLTAAVLLAAGLGIAAGQPDKPKGDKDLVQGVWLVTSGAYPLEKASSQAPKDQRLVFQGDAFILSQAGSLTRGKYRLSPAKQPKAIDLMLPGDRLVAIYELTDDEFKLCIGLKDRPTAFQATADQRLLTLKRDTSVTAQNLLAKAKAAADTPGKKPTGGSETPASAATSRNNLKQLALAFHNYHDTWGQFPPAASHGKDGKALLSWRVALLPYLDANDLYKRFQPDEPWDGPRNKPLLKEMPAVFAIGPAEVAVRHETYYQVFVGPGTLFDGPKGKRIAEITDGASSTLLVVEAARAVPWTKPEDLRYDARKPLPKLGGLFDDQFHVALTDGSTRVFKPDFNEQMMRRAITIADGQEVDFSKLER